ncbi:MAG: hypothetical protein CMK05_13720 [Ponticaulis sp.]|nr:hypothetical protein [Ponticaulis sp.]
MQPFGPTALGGPVTLASVKHTHSVLELLFPQTHMRLMQPTDAVGSAITGLIVKKMIALL